MEIDLVKLFASGGIALAILGISGKIIMYLVQEVKGMYEKAMNDSKEREKALMEHLNKSNDKLQSISETQNKISDNQEKITQKLSDIDNRVSMIERELKVNKETGG